MLLSNQPNKTHSSETGSRDNRTLIVLGMLFYLGWFGAIYFAKWGYPLASLVFSGLLVAFQLKMKLLTKKNVMGALAIVLAGVGFDSVLLHSGLVQTSNSFVVIPSWLFSIWVLFAFSMMTFGMRFHFPIWILAVMGAVFGPLSYKSGEVFGVLLFESPLTTWVYANRKSVV